jgi:hypothetical protein
MSPWPTPVLTDKRGSVIEVGSKVAYNISGDVAIGEVVKVGSPFHVVLSHNAAGMKSGHLSKVKRSAALIVLRANDHET